MAGASVSTLDNITRDYSPQYTGGPLYGNLLPGRRVKYTAERPGTSPAYTALVTADAPVGWWRLGETSGTTAADASGNGRTGTYSGAITLNQPGALTLGGDTNASALFPGTNSTARVEVPDHASLDLNAFTVECWVYLTSYGTTTRWRNIFQKNHTGGALGVLRNYGLWLQIGTNAAMHASFTTGGGAAISSIGPSSRHLALRRWHHLVLTHTPGSALRLYVDGEQSDVVAVTAAAPDVSTAPLYIGGTDDTTYPTLDYDAFPGRIDEVAVYATPLSAERIREHYSAGMGGRISLWTGILDDLPQHPAFGERTVDLPALGSLSALRGVQVSTDLHQNIRTDQALDRVLDAAGWPAADRRIGTGNTVLKWWWLDDRDALNAAVELLNTEGPGAALYEDGDGNVVFEGRYHRLTDARSLIPQAQFADDGMEPYRLDQLDYNPNLKGVVNAVTVEARERVVEGLQVVWSLGASISMGAGDSRPFKVGATDGSPILNAQTPVQGVDFTLLSGSIASVTLNRTNGGNVTIFLVAGATGATVANLQLRAQPVRVSRTLRLTNRVDTTTSRARYGERTYPYEMWPEVDPLVAQDFCDAVVNAYQEPRATLNVRLPAYLGGFTTDRALTLRVSDRVVVADFQTGLVGEALIEQVEYTHQDGELLVRFGCEQTSNAATNYLVWDSGRWNSERWGY
jgi:hypothetical protein